MSYFLVNLCEKDLLGSGQTTAQCMLNDVTDDLTSINVTPVSAAAGATVSQYRGYSIDQVSYCIEMCEETFRV